MRQPELRHIRAFVSVAQHLHFSRAAEALGIAAPSLTKLIQEMERLVGARLFHRTKRSVALTAAGTAYLADALAALEHLSRAGERAQFAERGELGRIAVGYVFSAVYAGVLQDAIREFRAAQPGVEFELEEIVMDQVGTLLRNETIDVAYVRPPVRYPEDVEAVTVHHDTFVLALPADSPLAAHDAVAPALLRDACFVLPEQDAGTMELARRGRFAPKLGPRPGSLAAVLARVALGGNVAVVPRTLADCIALPGVVYRAVAGRAIPSGVALAFRRHEREPAVRAFLRHVRQRGTTASAPLPAPLPPSLSARAGKP
ncbi:LysR family transcriptional regulator [Burkholderia sp. WAC0059]|uniref:LysR family transcriptional regulator n=1 Tax=Burkholderia sp. WAC0059 TaxID=2066022 RepID=UPI000C7ED4E7|nr:LysR family transcriptional regulator [Burkholderia sp. WAC0059]PLZ02875.1 LysR family transcriptional regulator [Burkholderia sp. WAC0059]